MANANTDYEKFVRDIQQALLNAQGLETVNVQHNVPVKGTSRSHQVDVYWEYRLAGVLHRVIIDCKHYKDTVEVGDVLQLQGVLVDIPGVRGVIATTMGFQKGAVDYAKVHAIGLKVIRAPEDSDWHGRLREIVLNIRIDPPVLLGMNTVIDVAWAKANFPDSFMALIGQQTTNSGSAFVRDLNTGAVESVNDIWNRLMVESPTEVGNENRASARWESAMFERPDAPALRVVRMDFHWKIEIGKNVMTTIIRKDPSAIVRDAIDGTLLFVDPDGTITGDVDEAIGPRAK